MEKRLEEIMLRVSNSPLIDGGYQNEAIRLVLHSVLEGLAIHRAGVWFLDQLRSSIRCELLVDNFNNTETEDIVLTEHDYPHYFAALKHERSVVADDAREDPATSEFKAGYLVPLGVTSMLDVAIRHHGRMIGIICSEHTGPMRKWTNDEVTFAGALADLVGRAINASQNRAAAEELARLNRELETRVEQRTAALSESNAALSVANKQARQALEDLRATQDQLIQAEKMASLGHLVANVAHEINTPIGAVKSSGKIITEALRDALTNMPRMFEILEPQPRGLFTQLVSQIKWSTETLTTREERAIIKDVKQQLEGAGIDRADEKAKILVQLNAHSAPLEYLPLLRHPECDFILATALSIGLLVINTSNINAAVDRVSKIVTTLRSFSQVDSVGEMSSANLKDGIETVLRTYQNQIKKGTELTRQYEDVPPLRCLPDELIQVWTHLIHNALQAIQQRRDSYAVRPAAHAELSYKGKLTIGLRCIGYEAVVSVTDSGNGIPDEIRGRIFEPFFTTRPPGEGAGLGLDIIKKIVEKHKGRVEVQSTVGVGSTFSVYLPFSDTTA